MRTNKKFSLLLGVCFTFVFIWLSAFVLHIMALKQAVRTVPTKEDSLIVQRSYYMELAQLNYQKAIKQKNYWKTEEYGLWFANSMKVKLLTEQIDSLKVVRLSKQIK